MRWCVVWRGGQCGCGSGVCGDRVGVCWRVACGWIATHCVVDCDVVYYVPR